MRSGPSGLPFSASESSWCSKANAHLFCCPRGLINQTSNFPKAEDHLLPLHPAHSPDTFLGALFCIQQPVLVEIPPMIRKVTDEQAGRTVG